METGWTCDVMEEGQVFTAMAEGKYWAVIVELIVIYVCMCNDSKSRDVKIQDNSDK